VKSLKPFTVKKICGIDAALYFAPYFLPVLLRTRTGIDLLLKTVAEILLLMMLIRFVHGKVAHSDIAEK